MKYLNKESVKYILTIPAAFIFIMGVSLIALPVSKLGLPFALNSVIYTLYFIPLNFLLVYLYNRYILHGTWSDIYVCRPAPVLKWIGMELILAAAVLGTGILLTEGKIARADYTAGEAAQVLVHSLLAPGICAGVVEELALRGFVLNSLKKLMGIRLAVIVQAFAFALMHLGGSLSNTDAYNFVWAFAAISIIGIAFALITIETGSIWTTALMHALYNQLDLFAVTPQGMEPSNVGLLLYCPAGEYWWLTGVRDTSGGMEFGFVSIMGLIIMSCIAIHLIRMKRAKA